MKKLLRGWPERPGGSHASDVGHWLRMTCSVRGFFITMTCTGRSLFITMTVLLKLAQNDRTVTIPSGLQPRTAERTVTHWLAVLTFRGTCGTISPQLKLIQCSWACAALGRTGNRVQIPNGTATVCVEAPHMAKAGHWGGPLRRQCGG